MLLLDKGFYDYDYEKVAEAPRPVEETKKSNEEVRDILIGFGFGHLAEKKPETQEEIQNYIIKEESHGS